MDESRGEELLMVRLYLAGSSERRDLLVRRLQQWEKLRGATVMQAIEGFGGNGIARGDAAPTVIEFFDIRDSAERVISDIRDLVDHIVYWPVQTVPMSLP